MALSILGALGFFMNELPLGSLSFRVRGKSRPNAYSRSRQMNTYTCLWVYGSFFYLCYWLCYKSSAALRRRDYIVVISARFEGICNYNSSNYIWQWSDLMTYLLRSYGFKQRNKTSIPRSCNFPANCTSLLFYPQCSHLNEAMIN